MEINRDEISKKKEWSNPELFVLNAKYTNSGSAVNRDTEDDTYTFPVIS